MPNKVQLDNKAVAYEKAEDTLECRSVDSSESRDRRCER
jgi:hypothetical protein